MLETLRNAFKIKDLRKRIGFTFLMLIVVRIGSQLPIPGVNPDVFKNLFNNGGDAMNFFDAITGGSFEKMSVFALNIHYYSAFDHCFPKTGRNSERRGAGKKVYHKDYTLCDRRTCIGRISCYGNRLWT